MVVEEGGEGEVRRALQPHPTKKGLEEALHLDCKARRVSRFLDGIHGHRGRLSTEVAAAIPQADCALAVGLLLLLSEQAEHVRGGMHRN